MTNLYRMIDELHAIVTSPDFFKVRYPRAVEVEPGIFVDIAYEDSSATLTITNITESEMIFGRFTTHYDGQHDRHVSNTIRTRRIPRPLAGVLA